MKYLLCVLLGTVLTVGAYAARDTALTIRDLRISNATLIAQVAQLQGKTLQLIKSNNSTVAHSAEQDRQTALLLAEVVKIEKFLSDDGQ